MKNGSDEHVRALLTIKTRLAGLSTPTLKEVVAQTFANDDDGAGEVMHHAIRELEKRIPEGEFVAFLNSF